MTSNTDIKEALTKVVQSTIDTSKGKKSSGTIIGTIVRDIPIIPIAPFSI